jgi:hypothetical protein
VFALSGTYSKSAPTILKIPAQLQVASQPATPNCFTRHEMLLELIMLNIQVQGEDVREQVFNKST